MVASKSLASRRQRLITPFITAELAGDGKWTRKVMTSGFALSRVAAKIGPGHRVVVGYIDDTVYLNRTFIDAGPVDYRPDRVISGHQEMLPGMAAVSAAERLQHRATRKMRPRVGQRGLAGTSLFGN